MARTFATYLYLNGNLHKTLQINRPEDTITLWSYPGKKRVGYTYSDVKKRMQKAFTLTEVGKMLNRHKIAIARAIEAGEIERPQYTYGLDDPEHKIYQYMMREEDIMAMHAALKTHHNGPPRKDGLITPKKMPTEREVRAMIRQNTIMYVKTETGFVPTWEAEQF